MHPTSHSSFVPDLDMNPPPVWSKPASALGLNNPLSHLPQSQQIRHLQEQIQHHRRLQHQQSHGYGIGLKKKPNKNGSSGADSCSNKNDDSGSTARTSTSMEQDRLSTFPQQGHQHINIKNTDDDMSDDEDIEEDEAFAPSSPLSPSSPGSVTSESSSMTTSMLSPGLLASSSSGYHQHQHQQQHSHSHGGNGIETSLASLASLSVMTSSGGSASSTTIPVSMPGTSRGRTTFPSHHSGHLATTPTSSAFQPQSLPMMYQNHGNTFLPTSVAGSQTPPFSAFSSALTHLHRQQEQQQMTSAGAMSSSLPAHTNFNPFQQPPSQPSQPQSPQMHEQQLPRSRSKSLTIPAPRIIPPSRVLPPRLPQAAAPRKYHGRQTRKLPNAPPTPKEPIDPTRRVAHIISEQKRREKINGGFEELKSVIPECAQNTDSKATILRKAVDYILSLEEELRKYVDLYQLETGSNPESSLEDHERER
ncbi:MAG: hypothetical protein J3Q66DRAFT_323742 [Benniella sp.]|nr:MAG: hypothetical protein J3Q66DRAFT_323742 [Benniella sp.]